MSQYQSFPDAAGASRTLDKLKALKLPDLSGRSFLDIGCNEGFFCGFAKFLGASRVVGLDKSKLFVDRARVRFPDCEFVQQDWTGLPDGPFDVILLASALHYADDQPALVQRLVERLSPDGTLVLELGIVSGPGSEWIEVERGIDRRMFPTMAKLREVLDDYAWKWMGRSVSQAGDPVSRHVVHISRRRPVAYLLMQPPGYGKSSLASRLFGANDIPVVSGDQVVADIAKGDSGASDALGSLVKEDYSPFRIDTIMQRIFDLDLGADLARQWLRSAGDGDFALDVFVPVEHHAYVEGVLSGLGYLPVRMLWDRIGPPLLSADALAEQAEGFYRSLPESVEQIEELKDVQGAGAVRGFVDELGLEAGRLVVRGWTADVEGRLPEAFVVRVNGQDIMVREFERQSRPDVQRHLRLAHPEVGYRIMLEVPGLERLGDVGNDFKVSVHGAGRLRLTGRVRALLSNAAANPEAGC